MKPTESAAPACAAAGPPACCLAPRLPARRRSRAAAFVLGAGVFRALTRRPRALPRRHRRLVARRPHRHHRRPSGRARPGPLVGRHRLRRRPHPRRPAAVRLGARRPGQPHRRRPGRHRPPAPLAAGRPARRGRHPRHRRRRPGRSPRSARCPTVETPWHPDDLDVLRRPRGRPGRRRLPRRHPRPAVVLHSPRAAADCPPSPAPPWSGRASSRVALLGIAPLICVVAVRPAGAAAAVRGPADRPRLHAVDRPGPRRGAAARPAHRAAQPAVAAGAHLDRAGRRRAHRRPRPP